MDDNFGAEVGLNIDLKVDLEKATANVQSAMTGLQSRVKGGIVIPVSKETKKDLGDLENTLKGINNVKFDKLKVEISDIGKSLSALKTSVTLNVSVGKDAGKAFDELYGKMGQAKNHVDSFKTSMTGMSNHTVQMVDAQSSAIDKLMKKMESLNAQQQRIAKSYGGTGSVPVSQQVQQLSLPMPQMQFPSVKMDGNVGASAAKSYTQAWENFNKNASDQLKGAIKQVQLVAGLKDEALGEIKNGIIKVNASQSGKSMEKTIAHEAAHAFLAGLPDKKAFLDNFNKEIGNNSALKKIKEEVLSAGYKSSHVVEEVFTHAVAESYSNKNFRAKATGAIKQFMQTNFVGLFDDASEVFQARKKAPARAPQDVMKDINAKQAALQGQQAIVSAANNGVPMTPAQMNAAKAAVAQLSQELHKLQGEYNKASGTKTFDVKLPKDQEINKLYEAYLKLNNILIAIAPKFPYMATIMGGFNRSISTATPPVVTLKNEIKELKAALDQLSAGAPRVKLNISSAFGGAPGVGGASGNTGTRSPDYILHPGEQLANQQRTAQLNQALITGGATNLGLGIGATHTNSSGDTEHTTDLVAKMGGLYYRIQARYVNGIKAEEQIIAMGKDLGRVSRGVILNSEGMAEQDHAYKMIQDQIKAGNAQIKQVMHGLHETQQVIAVTDQATGATSYKLATTNNQTKKTTVSENSYATQGGALSNSNPDNLSAQQQRLAELYRRGQATATLASADSALTQVNSGAIKGQQALSIIDQEIKSLKELGTTSVATAMKLEQLTAAQAKVKQGISTNAKSAAAKMFMGDLEASGLAQGDYRAINKKSATGVQRDTQTNKLVYTQTDVMKVGKDYIQVTRQFGDANRTAESLIGVTTKQLRSKAEALRAANNLLGTNQRSLGQMIETAGRVILSYASVTTAINAFRGAMTSSITSAAEFEQKQFDILKILDETKEKYSTMEKRQMAVNQLSEKAIDISNAFGQSRSDTMDVMQTFIALYGDEASAMNAAISANKLAIATNIDLASSSKTLVAVAQQFQLSANGLDDFVDTLNQLNNLMPTVDAGLLAENIKRVGAMAHDYGISIDYLGAQIAVTMEKTGSAAAEVGNMFKTVYANLKSDKGRSALADFLGMDKKELIGKQMDDLVKMMYSKASELNMQVDGLARRSAEATKQGMTAEGKRLEEQAAAIKGKISDFALAEGNKTQVSRFTANLTAQGRFNDVYDSKENRVKDAQGSALREAAVQLNSLNRIFQQTKNTFETIGTRFGMALIDPLKNILRGLNEFAYGIAKDKDTFEKTMGGFINATRATIEFVVGFGTTFASISSGLMFSFDLILGGAGRIVSGGISVVAGLAAIFLPPVRMAAVAVSVLSGAFTLLGRGTVSNMVTMQGLAKVMGSLTAGITMTILAVKTEQFLRNANIGAMIQELGTVKLKSAADMANTLATNQNTIATNTEAMAKRESAIATVAAMAKLLILGAAFAALAYTIDKRQTIEKNMENAQDTKSEIQGASKQVKIKLEGEDGKSGLIAQQAQAEATYQRLQEKRKQGGLNPLEEKEYQTSARRRNELNDEVRKTTDLFKKLNGLTGLIDEGVQKDNHGAFMTISRQRVTEATEEWKQLQAKHMELGPMGDITKMMQPGGNIKPNGTVDGEEADVGSMMGAESKNSKKVHDYDRKISAILEVIHREFDEVKDRRQANEIGTAEEVMGLQKALVQSNTGFAEARSLIEKKRLALEEDLRDLKAKASVAKGDEKKQADDKVEKAEDQILAAKKESLQVDKEQASQVREILEVKKKLRDEEIQITETRIKQYEMASQLIGDEGAKARYGVELAKAGVNLENAKLSSIMQQITDSRMITDNAERQKTMSALQLDAENAKVGVSQKLLDMANKYTEGLSQQYNLLIKMATAFDGLSSGEAASAYSKVAAAQAEQDKVEAEVRSGKLQGYDAMLAQQQAMLKSKAAEIEYEKAISRERNRNRTVGTRALGGDTNKTYGDLMDIETQIKQSTSTINRGRGYAKGIQTWLNTQFSDAIAGGSVNLSAGNIDSALKKQYEMVASRAASSNVNVSGVQDQISKLASGKFNSPEEAQSAMEQVQGLVTAMGPIDGMLQKQLIAYGQMRIAKQALLTAQSEEINRTELNYQKTLKLAELEKNRVVQAANLKQQSFDIYLGRVKGSGADTDRADYLSFESNRKGRVNVAEKEEGMVQARIAVARLSLNKAMYERDTEGTKRLTEELNNLSWELQNAKDKTKAMSEEINPFVEKITHKESDQKVKRMDNALSNLDRQNQLAQELYGDNSIFKQADNFDAIKDGTIAKISEQMHAAQEDKDIYENRVAALTKDLGKAKTTEEKNKITAWISGLKDMIEATDASLEDMGNQLAMEREKPDLFYKKLAKKMANMADHFNAQSDVLNSDDTASENDGTLNNIFRKYGNAESKRQLNIGSASARVGEAQAVLGEAKRNYNKEANEGSQAQLVAAQDNYTKAVAELNGIQRSINPMKKAILDFYKDLVTERYSLESQYLDLLEKRADAIGDSNIFSKAERAEGKKSSDMAAKQEELRQLQDQRNETQQRIAAASKLPDTPESRRLMADLLGQNMKESNQFSKVNLEIANIEQTVNPLRKALLDVANNFKNAFKDAFGSAIAAGMRNPNVKKLQELTDQLRELQEKGDDLETRKQKMNQDLMDQYAPPTDEVKRIRDINDRMKEMAKLDREIADNKSDVTNKQLEKTQEANPYERFKKDYTDQIEKNMEDANSKLFSTVGTMLGDVFEKALSGQSVDFGNLLKSPDEIDPNKIFPESVKSFNETVTKLLPENLRMTAEQINESTKLAAAPLSIATENFGGHVGTFGSFVNQLAGISFGAAGGIGGGGADNSTFNPNGTGELRGFTVNGTPLAALPALGANGKSMLGIDLNTTGAVKGHKNMSVDDQGTVRSTFNDVDGDSYIAHTMTGGTDQIGGKQFQMIENVKGIVDPQSASGMPVYWEMTKGGASGAQLESLKRRFPDVWAKVQQEQAAGIAPAARKESKPEEYKPFMDGEGNVNEDNFFNTGSRFTADGKLKSEQPATTTTTENSFNQETANLSAVSQLINGASPTAQVQQITNVQQQAFNGLAVQLKDANVSLQAIAQNTSKPGEAAKPGEASPAAAGGAPVLPTPVATDKPAAQVDDTTPLDMAMKGVGNAALQGITGIATGHYAQAAGAGGSFLAGALGKIALGKKAAGQLGGFIDAGGAQIGGALGGLGAQGLRAAQGVNEETRTGADRSGAEAGKAIGSIAGAAIGTALGGPVGAFIGSSIGSAAGDLLGGKIGDALGGGSERSAQAAKDQAAMDKKKDDDQRYAEQVKLVQEQLRYQKELTTWQKKATELSQMNAREIQATGQSFKSAGEIIKDEVSTISFDNLASGRFGSFNDSNSFVPKNPADQASIVRGYQAATPASVQAAQTQQILANKDVEVNLIGKLQIPQPDPVQVQLEPVIENPLTYHPPIKAEVVPQPIQNNQNAPQAKDSGSTNKQFYFDEMGYPTGL